MLVLSRKLKEKIVLPTAGATIQVLAIKGGAVRLGIEAPPEVPILREEVPDRTAQWQANENRPPLPVADEQQQHNFNRRLCERLTTAGVGLGLLRLQLDAGLLDEARATLLDIQEDLGLLRCGVEGEMENSPPKQPVRGSRRQKALLVEDDRNQRALLAGFLRQSGLEVDTANDGSDALDYLRSRGKPDVMLLDMRLPRVDGPTIVREIRGDPAYAGLKIFGVTGHLPDEFGLAPGPNGIDRWFLKPIDPGALLHELTKELDGSLCGL